MTPARPDIAAIKAYAENVRASGNVPGLSWCRDVLALVAWCEAAEAAMATMLNKEKHYIHPPANCSICETARALLPPPAPR